MQLTIEEDIEKLTRLRRFFNLFLQTQDAEILLSKYHVAWHIYPDFARVVFGIRKPHVHVYLPASEMTFTPSHLNIPIFPPGEKNIRAYTKCMEYYGGNIELVAYDSDLVPPETGTIQIWELRFFDIEFELRQAERVLGFKLSQNWTASFVMDATRIVLYYSHFLSYIKTISGDSSSEIPLSITSHIFTPLDTSREFSWIWGNHGKWKIQWIARVLDREHLGTRNSWFNVFNTGDIIIAHSTDVYYMPYIFEAGGIITENANLLSHASLISRELGIPLVLWVENIFLKIFDGDLIELDSDTGKVIIIQRFWEK